MSKKKHTYNGERGTVSYFARKYGVKPSTVWSRLSRGIPFSQALTMPKRSTYRQQGVKTLLYDGTEHTYRDWSVITGIAIATIRWRLKKGWSIGQTLGYEASPERQYRANSGDALCWKCERTGLSCEWVRSLKPVKGWEAKEITIDGEKRYKVVACPKFKG